MTPPHALVELIGRDGRVRQTFAVQQWPLRIGRAIDNDVVVDDPHAAAYHAVVEPGAGGALQLVALPSLNGVQVGRRRLAGGSTVALPAGEWQAGATRLRVRLAGEALAPERPLPRPVALGRVWVYAFALWAWEIAVRAVELDPGSRVTDWLQPVLGLPLGLAAWCLAWGLASKLFQHRFEFVAHLAVAVRGALAVELAGFALPWLAALGSWPLLSRIAPAVQAAIGLHWLWMHARVVLPQLRRALAWAAVGVFVLGTGVLATLGWQRDERVFGELYMTRLPPPALRIAASVAPATFLDEARPLQATLAARVRDAADEGGDDAEEAGD